MKRQNPYLPNDRLKNAQQPVQPGNKIIPRLQSEQKYLPSTGLHDDALTKVFENFANKSNSTYRDVAAHQILKHRASAATRVESSTAELQRKFVESYYTSPIQQQNYKLAQLNSRDLDVNLSSLGSYQQQIDPNARSNVDIHSQVSSYLQ